MRPTRIMTFMECAHVFAKRSTCMRLGVGAVIVKDRRIVSVGYNGVSPGEPHCAGNDCAGRHKVCLLTTHAERNAIEHAAISLKGADIYTTDSPCVMCAARIAEAGIRRVFFATPYRITESLDWLKEQGIATYRVTPAGYVIDWHTGDLVGVET